MVEGMRTHTMLLPQPKEAFADLRVGDKVLLSGPVFTMRDAGHMRTLEHLEQTGTLPYDLDGHVVFYAGPTPSRDLRPAGSVGPTTASRMDFAAPALYRAGIVATIGKGQRSPEVVAACKETGSVYFAAPPGAAAFLGRHVVESTTLAWHDLGTEALARLEVVDFPVYVAIDTQGNDLYEMIRRGEDV